MALVVNTNVSSLIAQKNLSATKGSLDQALERLSSGSRINSAADDAAGLAISARMEAQVRGLNQAVRNANDGISLAQTAEGAMGEITNMLQRMRELSVQSSSGVNTDADRASIQAEVDALTSEIDRIASTTEFNGKALLDGSFSTNIQVGSEAGQTIGINVGNMMSTSLGGTSNPGGATAVTSASFAGVEATATKSSLTFNANDTYNLSIVLGGLDAADDTTYEITGSVVGGNAKGIVDAINAALRDTPAVNAGAAGTAAIATAADSIRATYVGNTVTIENLTGEAIDVYAGHFSGTTAPTDASGLSQSGGTVTYTSIVGSSNVNAVNDNKTLGGAQFAEISMVNNGAQLTTATVSAAAEDASMTFNLLDGTDAIDAMVAGAQMVFELTANGVTKTINTGSMGAIADADDLKAELEAAFATAGLADVYDITASTTDKTFTVTRDDGVNFSLKLAASGTSLDKTTAGDNALTLAEAKVDLLAATTNVIQTTSDSINLELTTTTSIADALAPAAGSPSFTLEITDEDDASVTLETGAIAGTTLADIVNALDTAISNANASYTVAADSTTGITLTNSQGKSFSVSVSASNLKAGSTFTEKGADLAVSTSLAQTSADGVEAVTAAPATAATTSIMYLDFVGQDTYKFKGAAVASSAVDGSNVSSEVTVNYDGTDTSLQNAADTIQAYMNAIPGGTTYDFTATVENGRIKIEEANGEAFALTGFSSTGAGKIVASVEPGQQVSGEPSAVMLDDTTYHHTAGTDAAGSVTITDVDLTVASDDTYSFSISDGTATAVVSPVAVTGGATGTGVEFKAAIDVALTKAGLDDVIKTAVIAGSGSQNAGVTLTHALGYEISIDDFVSLGQGVMAVTDGDSTGGTTGIARFLDDDGGVAASETISKISVTSANAANDAITVLDRAIEQVSSQAGKLGAIQNRLDHTINNLTNISVNTSAAQSRIQDADYAIEAANLAKAQIMQQAGSAMLAQANAASQTVLSLLG